MLKNRNANLDIIRSFAVFFVLSVHSLINSGFSTSSMYGPGSFFMMTYWILAYCCVPLFIMLSGSLLYQKKPSTAYYIRYLKILVPYVFLSFFSLFFKIFYCHEQIGLKQFVGNIVNFYGCEYAWYLMLYTGLYMLIPFLNAMYNSLESKRQKQLLIFSFFVLSHLPSLLNSYVQLWSVWWKNLYPVTYYFLGAYVSEYKPAGKASAYFRWLILLLAVFSVYDIFYLDHDSARLGFIAYDNYQVLTVTVLIFCWITSLNTDRLPEFVLRMAKGLSSLSFYVFLLSGITDRILYPIAVSHIPNWYSNNVYIPFAAALSLIMSVLLALLLYPIGEWLVRCSVRLAEKTIGNLIKHLH